MRHRLGREIARWAVLAAVLAALLPATAGAGNRIVDLPGLSPHWPTGGTMVTRVGGGLELPDPGNDILVIFVHGSSGASHEDWCRTPGRRIGRGMAAPRVLLDLQEDDLRIHTFIYCTRARPSRAGVELAKDRMQAYFCRNRGESDCRAPLQHGALTLNPCGFPDDGEVDPALHQNPDEQVKACLIAAELMRLVPLLQERNPGLARERIFIAGTSNGAWSALFAQQAASALANAVIGFAPASVGKFALATRSIADELPDEALSLYRGELVDGRRRKIRPGHLLWMADNPNRALLFAFEGDPYETPKTLSYLRRSSGIEFVGVLPDRTVARACASTWLGAFSPHSCNHTRWFRKRYQARIRDFILCRVDDPTGACRPSES